MEDKKDEINNKEKIDNTGTNNYKQIKSFNISISDLNYILKICKSINNNENNEYPEQLILLCQKKKNFNLGNIKEILEEDKTNIYYKGEYTLEQLLNCSKIFNIFDSVDEIIQEIISLFEDKDQENISINLKEDSYNILELHLKFPFIKKKNKDVILELVNCGINQPNINDYFYKEILSLQQTDAKKEKEIKELTEQNKLINERIAKIEKSLDKLKINKDISDTSQDIISNSNQNSRKSSTIENNKQSDLIDSKLITKKEQIEFLNKRLHQDKDVPPEKKVCYKLLYRSTKDGDSVQKFHELCDYFPQTLTVIKTTKGSIIGGFTEETWKDKSPNLNGMFKVDEKAFVFSIDNKKTYNSMSGQPAIWCHKNYGPCFYGRGNFAIYIKDCFLKALISTNKISESSFYGMTQDYELNDGTQSFYAQDVEIFQIMYK